MKFLFAPGVFRQDTGGAYEVLAILRQAFEGRHVVSVEGSDEFAAWLGRRTEAEQHWIRRAVEDSLRGEPHVGKVVVRVCEATNWRAHPPRVSISDACALAHAPLRVVLEDFENDAHFLRWLGRAVESPEWHRVDRAMRLGWAEVVHGGGTGSILRLLKAIDETRADIPWSMVDARDRLKPSRRAERTWVMFDHDGLEPGEDKRGPDPTRIAAHLTSNGMRGRGLERRSIENYLPVVLLRRWADGDFDAANRLVPPAQRARRWVLVQAFARLADARLRRHYYVREGLRKDAQRDGSLPTPWTKLDEETLWALAFGFDALDPEGITRLFGHPEAQVKASVLRDDGSLAEARAIFRSIAEAL